MFEAILYEGTMVVAQIHESLMHLNDNFELYFGDKDMHFIVMAVLGMILFTVVSNLRRWSKNNASPRLTVPATVVAKRMNVSRHHTDNTMSHTFTTYYATFQVESGDRMELEVDGSDYGMLVEGDTELSAYQHGTVLPCAVALGLVLGGACMVQRGVLECHLQADRQKACRMGLVGRLHCRKHRCCVFCGVYPRNACSTCGMINAMLRSIFDKIAEAVVNFSTLHLTVLKNRVITVACSGGRAKGEPQGSPESSLRGVSKCNFIPDPNAGIGGMFYVYADCFS